MMNSRNAQFINDRLLLERREEYGIISYYLSVVKLEITIPISEQELEEINAVIERDFAIQDKKEQYIDDDIPF